MNMGMIIAKVYVLEARGQYTLLSFLASCVAFKYLDVICGPPLVLFYLTRQIGQVGLNLHPSLPWDSPRSRLVSCSIITTTLSLPKVSWFGTIKDKFPSAKKDHPSTDAGECTGQRLV